MRCGFDKASPRSIDGSKIRDMLGEGWLSVDEGFRSKTSQFAYLDLLATTLTEHEKNLDRLIKRLENISKNLSRIRNKTKIKKTTDVKKAPRKEEAFETIIYMKLKISRPTEELKLILDSLKE